MNYFILISLIVVFSACKGAPGSRTRDKAKPAAGQENAGDGGAGDDVTDGSDQADGNDDGQVVVEPESIGDFDLTPPDVKVGGAFDVSWTKAKNAESYRVWLGTEKACADEETEPAEVEEAKYSFTGITAGTRHVCVEAIAKGIEAKKASNQGAAVEVAPGWEDLGAISELGLRQGATAVFDGENFIVWGGMKAGPTYLNDGFVYDLKTDDWSALTQTGAPAGRFGHAAVWGDEHMIIWGGIGCGGDCGGYKYQKKTGQWSPISGTDGPPVGLEYAAAAFHDGKVWIYGGFASGSTRKAFYAYDVKTDTWELKDADPPLGNRQGTQVTYDGKKMYLVGGRNNAGVYYNTGYAYDFATNTFAAIETGDQPGLRGFGTAGIVRNQLVLFSGLKAPGDVQSDGGVLDLKAMTWKALDVTDAPARFGEVAYASGKDMLFFFGGGYGAGNTRSDKAGFWRHP